MGKFRNLITDSFMEKLGLIIEYGFAYLSTHPEEFEFLNSIRKSIEIFDKLQRKYPYQRRVLQKFTEHAFIDYITSLSQMAFKYMREHPETFDVIRTFFDEHEFLQRKMTKISKKKSKRDKNSSSSQFVVDEHAADDDSKTKTFIEEIRKLFEKLDDVKKQVATKNESRRKLHSRENKFVEESLRHFTNSVEEKLRQIDNENAQEEEEVDENFGDFEQQVVDDDEIRSSTVIIDEEHQQPSDENFCPIQEVVDKLETTLNSLKKQQSECLMKESHHHDEKSIILSMKCEGCSSSTLSDFKTTKDPNGQLHVELKLNFE